MSQKDHQGWIWQMCKILNDVDEAIKNKSERDYLFIYFQWRKLIKLIELISSPHVVVWLPVVKVHQGPLWWQKRSQGFVRVGFSPVFGRTKHVWAARQMLEEGANENHLEVTLTEGHVLPAQIRVLIYWVMEKVNWAEWFNPILAFMCLGFTAQSSEHLKIAMTW